MVVRTKFRPTWQPTSSGEELQRAPMNSKEHTKESSVKTSQELSGPLARQLLSSANERDLVWKLF